jgi:general L-amino acid transport system permease protein
MRSAVLWARRHLFAGFWSALVTLLLGLMLLRLGTSFILWAVVDAHWSVPVTPSGPDTAPCRDAAGACWAVIGEKYRFILFGGYPYDQQWRPALAVALFVSLFGLSAWRRLWRPTLALVWIAMLAAILALMWGGFGPLPFVPDSDWGGLPITMILSSFGCALAFPLAIAVALGRRAERLPVVRLVCLLYVELIRGVPLVALLFMASVMFPLFLPEGLNPDKLLRAQGSIILFAAAYLAEVIRGGLIALPRGQFEAADALGFSFWQKTRLIILPQALRLVVPPLVNTFTGLFKDTSLVLIIGLLDLLTASKVAIAEPRWQAYGEEIYLFVGAIYFTFCFIASRASRHLEAR